MTRTVARALAPITAALVVLLLAASTARADVVTSASPAFRLTMPDGFVPRRDKMSAELVTYYERPSPVSSKIAVFVAVQRLRRSLTNERPTAPEIADIVGLEGLVANATAEQVKWKGADIWMVRSTQLSKGRPILFLFARVPTEPEAIQLNVASEGSDEAETRAIMATLLAGLEGEATWEKARKAAEAKTRTAIAAGAGVVLVLAIVLIAYRQLSRR